MADTAVDTTTTAEVTPKVRFIKFFFFSLFFLLNVWEQDFVNFSKLGLLYCCYRRVAPVKR